MFHLMLIPSRSESVCAGSVAEVIVSVMEANILCIFSYVYVKNRSAGQACFCALKERKAVHEWDQTLPAPKITLYISAEVKTNLYQSAKNSFPIKNVRFLL